MKMSWRRHFPAGSLLLLWLGAMPAILPAVVAKATDGAGQKILDAMQSQASGAAAYKEGEVLVKFKRTMTRAEASLAAQDMDADVAREFPALSRLRQRTYVLITSGQRSTQQLLDGLRARPDVEAVSPNYRRRMQRLPNDPRWSLLWGLRMISAPDAWEINTGSAGVVLAVLDTGVDYRHKDLAANMWTNPGEIAGNGSDDDGNGYVDDIHGYDFAADNSGGVDGDPMDIDSHGSHVAGTIAAAGGNGEGVCGINWNARIMALKGFGPDGGIHDADSIAAIEYAVLMKKEFGVNLVAINASFGGAGDNSLQRDAIAAAGDEGIAFVCAAGNDGKDNDADPFYPAGYDLPNIISVAATDAGDRLADFSNYGVNTVDIAAPGEGILSTVLNGMGHQAELISGANAYQAIPMEYAGYTPPKGRGGLLIDCGTGVDNTFFPPAVHGNIALIERGTNSFKEKVLNAQAAGAVAAVIYNNDAGNFSGTLGDPGSWIPAISLAREDGLAEKALGIHPVTVILSTSDYEFMDGTSMAAPHVCGALGLLAAQYPADGMSKRIARLLAAADPLDSLEGKIKTGSRLNLARSLTQDLLITLSVFRRQLNLWKLKKDYAQVFFSAENDPGSGTVVTYGIYRGQLGGGLQLLKEVAVSELQNNSYTFNDKNLERGVTYSYQIRALNAQGEVIAVSNKQSI